jgi:hypothetical protein
MKSIKDSTLLRYADDGANLERSIAAHAELDRRFYAFHPGMGQDMYGRSEIQFEKQEQARCIDACFVVHDPREQS